MPPVPIIDTLPGEHRAWLEAELKTRGFGDYQAVTDALNARLAKAGLDKEPWWPLHYATVYRSGQRVKNRIAKVRAAAEMRAALVDALPQDDPDTAAKVARLIEDQIVDNLLALDEVAEEPDPAQRLKLLAKLQSTQTNRSKAQVAKAQAELAAAKFEAEQAIRHAERTDAAERAETAARGAGVSADGIEALRAAIMGAL